MDDAGRRPPAPTGIDRGAVAEAIAGLVRAAHSAPPSSSGRRIAAAGHYAGLLQLGATTIAVTTDTVGTKILLAEALGRWEEIGEDIVGVNVNDLSSVGARPAGLVDTLLCPAPDRERLAAIGRGLSRGLKKAACHLLGGETAIVPDLLKSFDAGGTAIGFFPAERRPILGEGIEPGDIVLGLRADGFHANGFTQLRALIAREGLDLRRRRPGARIPLGEEMLRPTRIYTRPIEAIADDPAVHGLAHISGGGVRNLARLHEKVRFDLPGWPSPHGIFEWAVDVGDLDLADAYETFNMGIGFAIVVAAPAAPRILARLKGNGGADAVTLGRIERGRGVSLPEVGVAFTGYG